MKISSVLIDQQQLVNPAIGGRILVQVKDFGFFSLYIVVRFNYEVLLLFFTSYQLQICDGLGAVNALIKVFLALKLACKI